MSGTPKMTVAEYRRDQGLPPRACDLDEMAVDAVALAKAAKEARLAQAEDELQRAIVKWLRYALREDVRFTHVPLGGKRRRVEAAIFKGLGVMAGWPDLIFAWSERHFDGAHMVALSRSAFMELKAAGGKLTDEQRDFQQWCQSWAIPHAVVRSLDDVVAAVRAWGIVNPAALRDLETNPAAEAAREES